MKKITSLESLRLFASLGVFQYHLWANYLGVAIFHPGTDYFMVLVGFVAAYSQARRIGRDGWTAYMRARYIRLYVTFIPLFFLTLIAKYKTASVDWVVRSFFFLPIPNGLPLIGATWMLSRFLLFYLLFSLAFLVREEAVLAPIFLFWVSGILAYTWFGWNPGLPSHWSVFLFEERNLDFVFGYIVGIIARAGRLDSQRARWLFWVGVAGVIGSTLYPSVHQNQIGRSLWLGLPMMLLILGLVTLEQQGTPSVVVRTLTKPWLVWLGGTSYVLYLSHGMYLDLWSHTLPITPLLVPLITLGGIFLGAAGYHFWEEPVLRYVHQRVWTISPFPPRFHRKGTALLPK
ncbi:MAG TPA: acyltransferase family protein [Caldilineaceae bacterium]|nr:acyltransferase family protein [Caldilineaceae bacterium]